MQTRRRSLLALAAVPHALAAGPGRPVLMLPGEAARRIGPALKNDPAAVVLRKLTSAALGAGPWSVSFHRPKGVEAPAGPNDYYSEGPYWWPDPKNPGGPYIRKDGERNPARFMENRRDLGEMCEAILSLGMGAYWLEDARCAERAERVLSVWFLDPKTRMSPHLEFGQAVRGRQTGRGTGIIDTVGLIQAAQGIVLMEEAGKLEAGVAAGLRGWYRDYLAWMTTSAKGLEEKKATNNHATWWTAQAAAYATYLGDAATRRMAWDHYRRRLAPSQIRSDGSCPREEARTRSLSYSSMNLDGFAVVCWLAELDGVDLWRYCTPQGIGVEKSFYYLLPYTLRPESWNKPQITPYEQDRTIFPCLAGLGLRSSELLAGYRKLPRAQTPWVLLIDLLVRSASTREQ